MPVFPSREWCAEAVRLVNADPEAPEAGAGWSGELGVVIDAEAGRLDTPFVVYARFRDGRIDAWRVLGEPDELDELEPSYRAQAAYSVWKGLLLGRGDPVQLILTRALRFQGELQPLVERLRYRGLAERLLSALETRFRDDVDSV